LSCKTNFTLISSGTTTPDSAQAAVQHDQGAGERPLHERDPGRSGPDRTVGIAGMASGTRGQSHLHRHQQRPARASRARFRRGAVARQLANPWDFPGATPAVYDRVATAVDLYKAGKVKKLLMTGDNRFVNYNGPEAMRKLAAQLGVPGQDIVLDYAGRRTYDSCYRAKEIFGVKQVVVVTQRFPLDRSLFLRDAMGVASVR
jgi:hypothetical protein